MKFMLLEFSLLEMLMSINTQNLSRLIPSLVISSHMQELKADSLPDTEEATPVLRLSRELRQQVLWHSCGQSPVMKANEEK